MRKIEKLDEIDLVIEEIKMDLIRSNLEIEKVKEENLEDKYKNYILRGLENQLNYKNRILREIEWFKNSDFLNKPEYEILSGRDDIIIDVINRYIGLYNPEDKKEENKKL